MKGTFKAKAKTPGAIADNLLIEKIKEGDYEAFEELVHKFETRIYNHCLKYLNSQEDAEDVLQETFVQVYKSLSTFRGDSAFSTWLMKIATNNCLMKIRKRKRMRSVSIDKPINYDGSEMTREIVDWSKNPSLMYTNDEIRLIIEKTISELPEDKRIVLILKDIEGFTNMDIAGILDMSVPAVKSRLHRARLFVREALTEYFDGSTEIAKMDIVK
ncbi:MAG TPA: sigma-70 family RNA polymerase sigma factor [Nitrospinota bacterium]|nr:sigma-70 family RNA polymerase sigma factor [Nitrospinota bacterium]|tara:strand:+ start:40654 stop:41298 length:645 start_codon:yes stop_codon:yes gene_type:complete